MSELRVDQQGEIVERGAVPPLISMLLSASPRLRVSPRFAHPTADHFQ
jgi:hypothetical protein